MNTVTKLLSLITAIFPCALLHNFSQAFVFTPVCRSDTVEVSKKIAVYDTNLTFVHCDKTPAVDKNAHAVLSLWMQSEGTVLCRSRDA